MPEITKCRICKGERLTKIFSLGNQPLANNLTDKPSVAEKFPLDLYQCERCQLVQLGYVVPKEKMFDTYFYVPSASKTNLEHFEHLADLLETELHLQEEDLVIDVGCSDGSFLKQFRNKKMLAIGIEPAKNLMQPKDIPVVKEYFSKNVANDIVQAVGKKAKLVTMTNVFAHIDDLHEVVQALDEILDDDGVFFAQFPDVRNLFEQNQFDTIYHEHLSYFTYEPLYYFFSRTKFEIFKITSDRVHGGSMQIWIRRKKDRLSLFRKNVENIKDALITYLVDQKKQGKRIIGFAAAAKGTVLLNYCGFKSDLIEYVVDDISWKQGKYIPGVNIPVVPSSHMKEKPPDIMLILAWNFKDEIIQKYKREGLTIVVPVPSIEIIL